MDKLLSIDPNYKGVNGDRPLYKTISAAVAFMNFSPARISFYPQNQW